MMNPIFRRFRQFLIAGIALLVAVFGCAYIYLSMKDYGLSSRDGWYFDQQGYEQALAISQRENRPILFYFRNKACQICKDFEKDILNNPDFIHFSHYYVKVRYTMDLNPQQQRFASQYAIRMQPALIVQFQKNPPISTHLVLPMHQVWVAQNSIDSGNHMPLSVVTLKLSLKRATEIARRQGMNTN